jgi:hypothetical protein
MLAKPLFESAQRFEAIGLDDSVRYLAVWRVASAAAFETPEYVSDWGFADYADAVSDWTRDLCELEGDSGPLALACPAGSLLHVVRVACADEIAARAAREKVDVRCPNLVWGKGVGLDRSVPLIGIQVLTSAMRRDVPRLTGVPVRQTLYRPLIPHTPATADHASVHSAVPSAWREPGGHA